MATKRRSKKKPTKRKRTIADWTCTRCGGRYLNAKVHLSETHCGKFRAFNEHVDVPEPTQEQAEARSQAVVCRGPSGRVVIELRRSEDRVTTLNQLPSGVSVEIKDAEQFDKVWQPMYDYPPGRAAALFVNMTQQIGGTIHALGELGTLITVTEKEKEVASKKQQTNKSRGSAKVVKDTKRGGKKVAKTERKPRNSAASMFRTLIMEGKLTDDQIFAKVQKAFELPDEKRSYVAWYRNDLKKKGQNPPEAKGGKKKSA